MRFQPLRVTSLHYLLTLLLLAATLGASVWSDRRPPAVLAAPIDSINTRIDGWTSTGNQQLGDTIIASLNATSYLSRTYRKDRSELDVFMAFYEHLRAGESMHSPKYCLPGGGWEFSDFKTVSLSSGGREAKINRAIVRKGAERQLLLYWYQSRPRVIASEYQSKFFLVWDGLVRGNQGGSIVRVMLPDRPGADQEGLAFAAQLIPEVQKCFGKRPADPVIQ
jgi:EpsI family protein